jgi:hypothetical protein
MMDETTLSAYRELKDYGVEVTQTNSVEFNSGSETATHVTAKALVGHIGLSNGYRVNSEVRVPQGDVDMVIWGHPDRLSYAVELEHSPTRETVESKVDRYVNQTCLDEIVVINLNEMPENYLEATEFIADELGLKP